MLTSIGLGLFILCVIYVAIWSVKNDGAPSIGDQTGFIRMRTPGKPKLRGRNRSTRAAPLTATATQRQPPMPRADRFGRSKTFRRMN